MCIAASRTKLDLRSRAGRAHALLLASTFGILAAGLVITIVGMPTVFGIGYTGLTHVGPAVVGCLAFIAAMMEVRIQSILIAPSAASSVE